MTNTESHKSVAVELPVYRVLKKVAETEFRTPSKQIAYLLNLAYPDVFTDVINGYDNEEPQQEQPRSAEIINFAPEECNVVRSQYRTWQVLVCLYKNRHLGPLRIAQISSAIKYVSQGNLSGVLTQPRDRGLLASRPISEGARETEWMLTDFGKFVASDLDENVPVRLTETVINQYERRFLRSAS